MTADEEGVLKGSNVLEAQSIRDDMTMLLRMLLRDRLAQRQLKHRVSELRSTRSLLSEFCDCIDILVWETDYLQNTPRHVP